MRTRRKLVSTGLPVLGTLVILGAVLLVGDVRAQIVLVVAGLILVEVGIWKLASPLLPNERRFHALRAEVDRFIDLVRELNEAAVRGRDAAGADESASLERTRAGMHASVERMTHVAGKTDQELEAEGWGAGSPRAPRPARASVDPAEQSR